MNVVKKMELLSLLSCNSSSSKPPLNESIPNAMKSTAAHILAKKEEIWMFAKYPRAKHMTLTARKPVMLPIKTGIGLNLDESMMVAIWVLSPNSANVTNVNEAMMDVRSMFMAQLPPTSFAK